MEFLRAHVQVRALVLFSLGQFSPEFGATRVFPPFEWHAQRRGFPTADKLGAAPGFSAGQLLGVLGGLPPG
jgi:hypothetical protein